MTKKIDAKKLSKILEGHSFKDKTFIGLDGLNVPKFLTESQRSRHVEIMGLSGSGKSSSIILPMIFQDICAEKSVVCMDGKGEIQLMQHVLASLLVKEDFKREVLGPGKKVPFYYLNPAKPELSCTYNPVHTNPDTDLLLLTERVFRAFDITHEHWGPVGLDMLRLLVRALHATKRQFNLMDIYVCLESSKARDCLFQETTDKGAVQQLKWKFDGTQRSREDAFAQFKVKLQDLGTPILNDYNPDILPEDLLREPSVLCVTLPESHKTLSYGLGNMLMQHLKTAISERFSDPGKNYPPCAIYLDEIQSYLNPEVMLSALAQFRSANCQLSFAHQSRHDLKLYSPIVADTIWVNSQMKIILPTNDPETAEKLSDILGTEKTVVRTYRTAPGPLFTTVPTYEASNQEADAYEKHPNLFKKLRPVGQGFLLSPVTGGKEANPMDHESELHWTLEPLNFARFPEEITHPLSPPSRIKRGNLEGLHLYARFVAK